MAWREEAILGNVHVRKILDVAFSVAAEDTNTVTTAVTVTSSVTHSSMEQAIGLQFYMSSDAAGQVPEAGTDLACTAGTNGALYVSGGDSSIDGTLITETTGLMDFVVTDVGTDTYYLNVIMPDGRIETSSAITLAA